MKKVYKWSIPIIVIFISIFVILYLFNNKEQVSDYYSDYKYDGNYTSYVYVDNKEEYEKFLNTLSSSYEIINKDLVDDIGNGEKYLIYGVLVDTCNEILEFKDIVYKENKYKVYYDVTSNCGVCAPIYNIYIFKVDYVDSNVELYYKIVSKKYCDHTVVKKPMIYIYPNDTIDLKVYLNNTDILLHVYPKYNGVWNLRVSPDGTIYDYDTKRNYYALYWDAIDETKLNEDEGFVVEGSKTVEFLEEKLELLGLNEREINEFIVYWIDMMENNAYNFIRFRTMDEINNYMPLTFDKIPDTLIRVIMDFKPLDEYKEVKEQKLDRVERKGFTIVEWGGCEH